MGNQDWSNLGEQIKNSVQDAIDSQNFRQLNESIRNTVNSAMDNVNQSLNNANQSLNGRNRQRGQYRGRMENPHRMEPQNPWETKRSYEVNPRGKDKNELLASNSGMKGAGYSLSITGYIFAGSLGLAIFILGLVGLINGFAMGQKIAIGVMLPFLLASSIMAFKGSKILGRLKRFRQYSRQLSGRTFCSIKELADATGRTNSYVLKDLKTMIQKNMFRQGHVDSKGTCLMITDEVYNQYLETEHQMEIRQREEQANLKAARQKATSSAKAEQKADKKMPDDVKNVIKEGNDYIQKIKDSNDAIKGEEVSRKITRLELITSKIFERVVEHPEHIPDLRKFMEYYLPTTVKLLDAYEELERQPVQGENIITSQQEIEKTLDTINQAFEKLLDGFFQDTSWDISSDISVLQTMFAQEGLTGQDFKKNPADAEDSEQEIKLKF